MGAPAVYWPPRAARTAATCGLVEAFNAPTPYCCTDEVLFFSPNEYCSVPTHLRSGVARVYFSALLVRAPAAIPSSGL